MLGPSPVFEGLGEDDLVEGPREERRTCFGVIWQLPEQCHLAALYPANQSPQSLSCTAAAVCLQSAPFPTCQSQFTCEKGNDKRLEPWDGIQGFSCEGQDH